MNREVHTSMKISSIKHFIKDALKSLNRNRTIGFASAATVAATLFILGIFLITALDVKQIIKDVESKVEIKVFLSEDVTIGQEQELKDKFGTISDIKEIKYESKEDAIKKFKEQLGEDNESLIEGLEKRNPLPNSYILKVSSPESVTGVVEQIKDMEGIYQVQEGRKVVDTIIKVTNTIKWAGIAMFIVLIGVSLFLIGNTIKITVYSRRKEIGIMKFIGATDWFIRWPFIIEGMIIGLSGAVIGCIVLYYTYLLIYTKITSAMFMIKLVGPSFVLSTISWQFILLGMIIGALGSILSIRKFLAV